MATFIQLVDYNSSDEKEREFCNQENKFVVNEQDDFSRIPGNPIVYWVSDKVRNLFLKNKKLDEIIDVTGSQNITANNNKYLRFLWEVSKKTDTWVLYSKGGEFRRWYGNINYLVDWSKEARNYYNTNKTSNLLNEKFWFREGISYSAISSYKFSARFVENHIYDKGGPTIHFRNENEQNIILSLLNSKIGVNLLYLLNSTLNYQVKDLKSIPIIFPKSEQIKSQIHSLTQQCIDISREEWDSQETSWDFTTNELLRHKTSGSIEDAYNNYCLFWKDQFFKLHTNEEELNRIFIDIYDLADELTPDVPLEDITILKDESEIKDGELVFKKDVIIKQFISYAVGCMFGRYSPDREGLILANQGETIDDFREKVPDPSFMPNDDNIIPILEDEYFTDDIVSRFKEFLKATFGAESLAENLDFIAGALSKSKNGSKSPEKTVVP